jgi:hypothetical protein
MDSNKKVGPRPNQHFKHNQKFFLVSLVADEEKKKKMMMVKIKLDRCRLGFSSFFFLFSDFL